MLFLSTTKRNSGLGVLQAVTYELTDVGDYRWAQSPAGRASDGSPKRAAIKQFGPNGYKGLAYADLLKVFGGWNVPVKVGVNGDAWFIGSNRMPPTLARESSGVVSLPYSQLASTMRTSGFLLAVPGGINRIAPWLYWTTADDKGRTTEELIASQAEQEKYPVRKDCGSGNGLVTAEQAKQIVASKQPLPPSITACLDAWSKNRISALKPGAFAFPKDVTTPPPPPPPTLFGASYGVVAAVGAVIVGYLLLRRRSA